MNRLEQIVKALQEGKSVEATDLVKTELTERADALVAEGKAAVASQFTPE